MEKNSDKILALLTEAYPNVKPALNFRNPYETLIATMLSAQSTDKQVNKVTPKLFNDFPTVEALASSTPEIVYPYVKSCGFKSKAKNIVLAAQKIMSDFNGKVPDNHKDLTSLPGVGIKTADVVLSHAFNVPAIAVDTHVFRVSNRLKLADADTVEKTRAQLMELIPKADWSAMHLRLIEHGRQICKARNPLCEECPLKELCPEYKNNYKKIGEL
ncbi:MAG: endonuclease III [Eubacteriales bacterium]|nr:endonuclease III [Eubacteriales bacterium]